MIYGFQPMLGYDDDDDRGVIFQKDFQPEPLYCPRSDVLTQKDAAIWLHSEESRIETKFESTWKAWFDFSVLSQAKPAPKPAPKPINRFYCGSCRIDLPVDPERFVLDPKAKAKQWTLCPTCLATRKKRLFQEVSA